jgi:hypothetical protein
MDFLKEILGEDLFAQVAEKINAHNGNEANKENQIKIGNLGGGDYVSKAKHDALQALFDSKDQELTAANGLIEGFQKSQKDNEAVQGQITAYKDQVAQLQEQLKQTQIDSGLKIALMEAGGTELDFLIWKAKNENGGKPLELGEDGKIKGIDDMISGLKTSAPNHFKKAGGVKVEENPLPTAKTGGMTRAEFMRKPYAERAAFANENPEAYKELMNN